VRQVGVGRCQACVSQLPLDHGDRDALHQ
jgi:hypothetical protein